MNKYEKVLETFSAGLVFRGGLCPSNVIGLQIKKLSRMNAGDFRIPDEKISSFYEYEKVLKTFLAGLFFREIIPLRLTFHR